MTRYCKPALSASALYAKITSRGLVVIDPAAVQAAFENIGYYRIAAYARPFLDPPARKVFKSRTTWDQIARLYEFDRELRLLVNDAIERIEVGMRARVVTETTLALPPLVLPPSTVGSPATPAPAPQWGPHWFTDPTYFHPKFDHPKFIRQIEKDVGVKYDPATHLRSLPSSHSEVFIDHYYRKYGDPYLPPFWMVAEIMTLGGLSQLYKGLGDPHVKASIAAPFRVTAKVMQTWLHSLAHLRNVCAHHGRLWNRVFSIAPLVPPRLSGVLAAANRFEGHATVLREMLAVAAPADNWRKDFQALLGRFPEVDVKAMGFGGSWATPYWQA